VGHHARAATETPTAAIGFWETPHPGCSGTARRSRPPQEALRPDHLTIAATAASPARCSSIHIAASSSVANPRTDRKRPSETTSTPKPFKPSRMILYSAISHDGSMSPEPIGRL
jgi:hypothetical protein